MATHHGGLLSRRACLVGAAVAVTVILMLTTWTGTTMMGESSSLVHASPSSVPQRQLQVASPTGSPAHPSVTASPSMSMQATASMAAPPAFDEAVAAPARWQDNFPQLRSRALDLSRMHTISADSSFMQGEPPTMAFQVSGAQDTNNVHDNVANGFLPRLSALQVRPRRLDATRYTSSHVLVPPRSGRGRHQRPLL